MPTTIVNPPTNNSGNNVMGLAVVVIVLLLLGFLFFVYGLPYLRTLSGVQINVPKSIDVNVKQSK